MHPPASPALRDCCQRAICCTTGITSVRQSKLVVLVGQKKALAIGGEETT